MTTMPSKKLQRTADTSRTENSERRLAKRSLSRSTSAEVNTTKARTSSKRYKTLLTCMICEGDAHGYNFDAISCESCKAFFRRNALRSLEKLKCRGNGNCDVTSTTKKRCKKCRLEKCLTAGMRKEWILSEKERAEKRAKIEANRRMKQMHDEQACQQLTRRDSKIDNDFSPSISPPFLTDLQWSNIHSMQESFTEAVRLNQIAGIASYPFTQRIESTLELFRIPLYISSMRLIGFIKQLNEFQQLDKQDQVYLVKLNLLTICFFHSIFAYDPRSDCYREQDTNDPLFSGKDWNKTLNPTFHAEMKQLRNDLLDIFQMDNIVIKLFYIIILFSQQLSINQSSQCSLPEIHSSDIFKAQNVFTNLVYRYCMHQYGPSKAPIFFTRYLGKIMKLQQLVDEMKSTIDCYMDVTQLSPLTQSLLV